MKRQPDRRQLTLDGLYEIPSEAAPQPGTLKIDIELRLALNRALKETVHDREEIAADMSRLTGDPITRYMLDAWTGASRKPWRFPLEYLPAFIMATGAHWLLDRLARHCGCRALAGEEIHLAEIARIDAKLEQLKDHRKQLTDSRRGRG